MSVRDSVDNDFNDLEGLLEPEGEAEGEAETETDSDGLSDLDDLLQESLQYASDTEKLKEARKKLSKHNYANAAERAAIEEKVATWELQRVWLPAASVIYFTVQHCDHCRSEHHHFTGYFQRQRHKVSAIDRWIFSDKSQIAATPTLPKEVKEVLEHVQTCIKCFFRPNWNLPLDLTGAGAADFTNPPPEEVAAIVVAVIEKGNCDENR